MTVIDKLLIYQIYIFIVSFLANLLAFILYILEWRDTIRLYDDVILTSEEREGLYTEEVDRLEEGINKGLYDSEAQLLSQRDCSICMHPTKDLNCIILPECGHKYHRDCIFAWLKRKAKCPLC